MKICNECGKEFSDGRKLYNHSKIHNRNDTFQNREWLYNQYWNLNKSQLEIAKKCNICQTNIQNWMKKLNIPSRTISETLKDNKRALGMKHTEKTKKMLSEKFKGIRNPAWKGNEAKYNALHMWVRKRKIKPPKCEICNKKTEGLELAKISEKYTRNLEDYKYICYRCHKILDGTIYNILSKDRTYHYGGESERIL